jgi:signal transduction histidine kinase
VSEDSPAQSSPQTIDLLFLGNFVHQVVNPLNGIAGTLDNVAHGIYSFEDSKRKVNAARAQLEGCISLVRNLAFFSEVSSATKQLTAPRAHAISILPQIIIEAAMFYQDAAQSRNIEIALLDRDTQYRIKGRPEALRQVFMNLFDNATKYGDSQTKVTIEPRVQQKNRTLLVEIKNIGIGFTGQESDRFFELGVRGREAKESKALGTGLGLYICRRIMEDFIGGSISVSHNSKKRETTFQIRFPTQTWSAP